MPAALGSGQGSAGRKVCATLQTLLLLFPCPQLPAQCYLGTSEPDRPPQGPRWTSLSIPCMLLPVSSASIMDLGQHSQSLARTIWARAGGSATRSVERATEQPDPCDWWGRKGACAQPEHGWYTFFMCIRTASKQGTQGSICQVPDELWPSSPHPRHKVCVFALAKSRCTKLSQIAGGTGRRSHVGKYRSPGMEHTSDCGHIPEPLHLCSLNFSNSTP